MSHFVTDGSGAAGFGRERLTAEAGEIPYFTDYPVADGTGRDRQPRVRIPLGLPTRARFHRALSFIWEVIGPPFEHSDKVGEGSVSSLKVARNLRWEVMDHGTTRARVRQDLDLFITSPLGEAHGIIHKDSKRPVRFPTIQTRGLIARYMASAQNVRSPGARCCRCAMCPCAMRDAPMRNRPVADAQCDRARRQ